MTDYGLRITDDGKTFRPPSTVHRPPVGWQRNAFAFVCGVLATLTLPPFFLFPLLIPAFTGLYWLVDSAPSNRRAFFDGWWWGWGFYITGLYWFCIALLTDPEKFAWLIPFALFALTAVIAIYSGVACWLFKLSRCRGVSGVFVFSIIWTLVEYARGHLFTGFPWNLAGYSFAVSDVSIQLASLAGAYGLTWFAVLLGVVPALFWCSKTPLKRAIVALSCTYAALSVGLIWGAWELRRATDDSVLGVKLRLVQANISQHRKWDPQTRAQGLEEHIRLTHLPGLESITHVIWPESAVPYVIRPNDTITERLGHVVPPKTMLITGALRMEGNDTNWDIYNSVITINHKGSILNNYDKHQLVPFGEFLPFRSLLPESWLTPVGAKDFASGHSGVTLEIPDQRHRMLPLICYEAIFPEMAISDRSFAPPSWMLNLTNDAWFGFSTGPYQHFEMARMRAVEQGLPLVRVANTGISAIVDGFGRVMARLDLGQSGVLDSPLPMPKPHGTFYSKYKDIGLILLTLLGFTLILGQYVKRNP